MEEILIIREEDFWEKEEALQHIAEALFFPADYGMNLDALYDCLCDLGEDTNLALVPAEPTDDWFEDLMDTVVDASTENEHIHLFQKWDRD